MLQCNFWLLFLFTVELVVKFAAYRPGPLLADGWNKLEPVVLNEEQ